MLVGADTFELAFWLGVACVKLKLGVPLIFAEPPKIPLP
jgi:hypothetical protein